MKNSEFRRPKFNARGENCPVQNKKLVSVAHHPVLHRNHDIYFDAHDPGSQQAYRKLYMKFGTWMRLPTVQAKTGAKCLTAYLWLRATFSRLAIVCCEP